MDQEELDMLRMALVREQAFKAIDMNVATSILTGLSLIVQAPSPADAIAVLDGLDSLLVSTRSWLSALKEVAVNARDSAPPGAYPSKG